jgi:hypothetical protein
MSPDDKLRHEQSIRSTSVEWLKCAKVVYGVLLHARALGMNINFPSTSSSWMKGICSTSICAVDDNLTRHDLLNDVYDGQVTVRQVQLKFSQYFDVLSDRGKFSILSWLYIIGHGRTILFTWQNWLYVCWKVFLSSLLSLKKSVLVMPEWNFLLF